MSEPRPASDVIAGLLAGLIREQSTRQTSGYTTYRDKHVVHVNAAINTTELADALIAAGVTMPAPPCEHGVSASSYCPACGKCNCASCNDDGGGFWSE